MLQEIKAMKMRCKRFKTAFVMLESGWNKCAIYHSCCSSRGNDESSAAAAAASACFCRRLILTSSSRSDDAHVASSISQSNQLRRLPIACNISNCSKCKYHPVAICDLQQPIATSATTRTTPVGRHFQPTFGSEIHEYLHARKFQGVR